MRSRPWIRLASLALALSATAGCASRAPTLSPEARSAELLSATPPPAGRTCQVIATPADLPAADRLVEVDALAADLGDLRLEPRDAAGYVLLTMGYDRFGSNIRRTVIEHNVRKEVADSVQKLVFKHRRTADEGEDDWGVRLRIDLDGPPRFAVGRQEFCAPRPRDHAVALAMETTMGAGTRMRDGYRESTLWVRLWVAPSGTVTRAAVERGIVSGLSLEQRVFDYVRTLFFEPALADGHPVTGTISVPVRVLER